MSDRTRLTREWLALAAHVTTDFDVYAAKDALLAKLAIWCTEPFHVELLHEDVPLTWWDHLKLTIKEACPIASRIRYKTRQIEIKRCQMNVCPHMPTEPVVTHVAWASDRLFSTGVTDKTVEKGKSDAP